MCLFYHILRRAVTPSAASPSRAQWATPFLLTEESPPWCKAISKGLRRKQSIATLRRKSVGKCECSRFAAIDVTGSVRCRRHRRRRQRTHRHRGGWVSSAIKCKKTSVESRGSEPNSVPESVPLPLSSSINPSNQKSGPTNSAQLISKKIS